MVLKAIFPIFYNLLKSCSKADYKSDRLIKLEDDKITLDTSCERSTVFVISIFRLGTITLSNEY